ncbi:uncharacterized protein (DUF1499 family) [Microvirga flocculans]|uniref:Uncharacterized protein (DUF1499 family) n=1 Tax=Microvirga flocculans TaxID=217168 RepID=A0A7W6N8B5_9HYPH|nr:DUF1499 domain-containing protein [Microvirga flocculans]MBB4040263.1 uncharacterized protein (DUF1499 family) [Microvirga flocculans]
MRRLIIEEPFSRPAKWSPTLAWFALVVTLLATLLIRFGRIDFQSGFIALGAGIAIALLAVGLSFIGFVRIWQEGRRGLGSAIKGLLVAALVLAYPGYMALKAVTLPPISDVSTDTDDPPAFSRSRAALQARDGHVPPEAPPEAREMQRASYVQIAPLTLDIGPEEAFGIVRKAAENLGWQVIEAVPPGGRSGQGRLEAIDRSLVLKMPYDITVRVRPRADGTRIDIRSASRYGGHDLGGNADRVRDFLEEASTLAIAVR